MRLLGRKQELQPYRPLEKIKPGEGRLATTRKGVLRSSVLVLAIVIVYALVRVGRYASEAREASSIVTIGTLNLEYVIDPTDARWHAAPFGQDFDVTSSSTVVLRNGNFLYEIRQPFGKGAFSAIKVNGAVPDSFAVDNDDVLLTVAGGYFGMLDETGATVDAVPLPDASMHLAHSALDGVVYLYGGEGSDHRLYSFGDNGAIRILLQLDEPIIAVADNHRSIYVATATRIFRVRDNQLSLLLKLSHDEEGPIRSLAAALDDDLLFFSTDSRVYAFRGDAALSIVNNSGGSLRLRGDTLYVLDDARGVVFALRPATRQLFG
jgi:hypothetical protein